MKKSMKAYILIDAILVLVIILTGMIEYGIGTLVNFHYPEWVIYPTAVKGATMSEAYSYYFSQSWWWITIAIEMIGLLYLVPKVVYPALCKLEGREK